VAEKQTYEELEKRIHDLEQANYELIQSGKDQQDDKEHYRSLIHSIQAAVVVHGTDTKIIASNHKAQELLGLTEAQMLGRIAINPEWKFLNSDNKKLPLDQYPVNQVLNTRQVLRDQILGIYRPDTADSVWVIVNADPVFNEEKEIKHVVVTFMDITDRMQAEEALKGSEERLTEAQKLAKLGHYIFDIKKGSWTSSIELNNILGIDDSFKKDTVSWIQVIHPDHQKIMSNYFQDNILTQQQKFDKEYKTINKRTGQEYWVHGLGELKLDKNSKPIEMFGTIQDITERKQVADELKKYQHHLEDLVKESTADFAKSEGKYRHLVENMHEGIAVLDENYLLTYVNDRFSNMLGYQKDEVIGRLVKSFFDEANLFILEGQLARRKKGESGSYEISWTRKDGSKVPVWMSSSPLLDEDGKFKGSFAIVSDLTEKKHAELEKEELEFRLNQSQKIEAIGTLAGGIAHDFNNILSAIFGFAELAREDLNDPVNLSYDLDEVINGANRAKELVKQILTFSRRGDLDLKPLKVQLVIREALKLLRSSIPTTIEIKQKIDPDCKTVLADPTQVHQIIMNLCTNAYQAMRDTGGVLGVYLKPVDVTSEDIITNLNLTAGQYIQLEVSDSGHGMTKDILAKAFEPYFTTKPKGEGTGLGLAVVHGIARSFNGDITVYSEPGMGTTFHVYLPVVESTKKTERYKEIKALLPTGNERILLVDDDETITDINKRILEKLGYKVATLTSSVEALDTFQKAPDSFDLIITDMTMPKMTGADLAKHIIVIRPDIPIILSTGHSELINEEKAKKIGIKDYIMKPVTMKDLAETTRKVLDAS
jgi:PAS domain S-box-containing protein